MSVIVPFLRDPKEARAHMERTSHFGCLNDAGEAHHPACWKREQRLLAAYDAWWASLPSVEVDVHIEFDRTVPVPESIDGKPLEAYEIEELALTEVWGNWADCDYDRQVKIGGKATP